MLGFFSKLLGTPSAQPMNYISCERVYCLEGGEPKDTLYEHFPSGTSIKRGCC